MLLLAAICGSLVALYLERTHRRKPLFSLDEQEFKVDTPQTNPMFVHFAFSGHNPYKLREDASVSKLLKVVTRIVQNHRDEDVTELWSFWEDSDLYPSRKVVSNGFCIPGRDLEFSTSVKHNSAGQREYLLHVISAEARMSPGARWVLLCVVTENLITCRELFF